MFGMRDSTRLPLRRRRELFSLVVAMAGRRWQEVEWDRKKFMDQVN